MDAVITYVNMSDPVWIKQYQDTFKDKPDINRFRELGTLQLQVNCIRKFMPWINNIFIVVSTKSQVQNIVGANIITHDQIIPKQYLPTFNSCTIELFLHKIPGLSDYFIYFNDDIFPIDYVDENAFFDGKPVLSFKTVTEPPMNVYRHQCKNSSDLARKAANLNYSDTYIKTDHICNIHSKTAFEYMWSNYENQLRVSITKKRSSSNFNQYLFDDYLFYSNQCKIKRQDYLYIEYKKYKPEELYSIITEHKCKLICIQDNALGTKHNDMLISALEKIAEVTDPVDLVVPYVDNTDSVWLQEYNKYIKDDSGCGSRDERFRSHDMFCYFFRSIEKNMPWINRIFVLVQSDSQVPNWLNKNNITIVKHADFIPSKFLPTFNSCTIEMFLHRIPGLSEKFIYANDDMFVIGETSKQDFFQNNIPVFGYKEDDYHSDRQADHIRYNIHKLIRNKDDNRLERIQHTFTPYLKSTCIEVYKKYERNIIDSITRFRDDKNLCQWMYAVYQIFNLKHVNKILSHVKTKLKTEKAAYLDSRNFKCICFNDSERTTEQDVKTIKDKLNLLFPTKSKYEL